MIHKIEFTISMETHYLHQEEYMKLQEQFYSKIADEKMPVMTFEEINKILELDKKKFYATSIEFPEMTHNEDDFTPRITKIGIKA
jgi:hypothetical protein